MHHFEDIMGVYGGEETQVNTSTAGDQENAAVTRLADGGWVVTWEGLDGNSSGIFQQRYHSDGSPSGLETRVNSTTLNLQDLHQVTPLNDGGWVVVWKSENQDGDDSGIYLQAFNDDGSARGIETQVNTYADSAQTLPQISALADGRWVVSWTSDGQDGSSWGIFQNVFEIDASSLVGEVQVNTYATGRQSVPHVTAFSGGGWVVTWESDVQDGSGKGIYQQAFNSFGVPLQSEVRVNTYTNSDQLQPVTAALEGGGWVVVWVSSGQDGNGYGIYQQVFDSGGNAIGSETQVNTYALHSQADSKVAALAGGG